jgi:hypothetical protein
MEGKASNKKKKGMKIALVVKKTYLKLQSFGLYVSAR